MVIRHSVIWFSVVSLLLASLQSGCSFLFVKGPPANHAQMQTFDCSESNALPVLDLIWAGLNGLGAASAGGDDENLDPMATDPGTVVAVGLAWLAISGVSAIYGFSKVSSCKDAKRLREERYVQSPPGMPASTPAAAAPPSAAPLPAAAPAPTIPVTAPLRPTASTPAGAPPTSASPQVDAPAPPASPSAAPPPAAPPTLLHMRS